MKEKKMQYPTIDAATTAFGLGVINNYSDLLHSYGVTTKGILVWLPIVDNTEKHWNNKVYKDYILEIAKADTTKRMWRSYPLKEKRHVITRTSTGQMNKYDYSDIGNYCPICTYVPKYLTIFTKVGSREAQGDVMFGNGPSTWLSGFASNENEVLQKILNIIVDNTVIS
jgi:hypothetical protein